MIRFVIIIVLVVLFPVSCLAVSPLINEFSVDPSQTIELINTSTQSADISHWYLDDNGGTTYFTIPDNTVLYPNSCLTFSADFNLNKSSPDSVRLFDNSSPPTSSSARLIDSFTYQSAPSTNTSYSRIPDASSTWITGAPTFGKFNSTQQNCIIVPTTTPTPTPLPTNTPSPSPTVAPQIILSPTNAPSPVANIYISEAMVNPETGEHEWVELYNDNDQDVTLTNWYIDDEDNAGSSPKQFSLTIPAKGYAVVTLATSLFNNDGDFVRLLDDNKIEKDSVRYITSEKGKTIGKTDLFSAEVCMQIPSPNELNNDCEQQPTNTPIPTAKPALSPTRKPTAKILLMPTAIVINKKTLHFQNTSVSFIAKPTTVQKQKDEGVVLSAHDEIPSTPTKSTQPLLASLSFSSFSFSAMTLLSIIMKIKSQLA